jgi:hypothetical protein
MVVQSVQLLWILEKRLIVLITLSCMIHFTAGIPPPIIDVIHCSYSKLFVTVRWYDSLSDCFYIPCDVLPGSIMSPYIFNSFVNILISQLKLACVGCHIENNL